MTQLGSVPLAHDQQTWVGDLVAVERDSADPEQRLSRANEPRGAHDEPAAGVEMHEAGCLQVAWVNAVALQQRLHRRSVAASSKAQANTAAIGEPVLVAQQGTGFEDICHLLHRSSFGRPST